MPRDAPDNTDSGEHSDATDPDSSLPLRRRTVLKGTLASSIAAGGFPVVADSVAAQQTSDEDWPQFQFDTANTGHNPDGTGPTSGVASRWDPFPTSGRVTSPVVVDGVVFVGSEDGNVYAVDAATGDETWRFGTGGQITAAPAVVNGSVYVGNNSETVYALNASDGSEQWQASTTEEDNGVFGLSVAAGTVFVGDADRLFAFDAADGSELWQVDTGECFGGGTSPAVADSVVYITEDCGKTWALNASDGAVQWKFDDGSDAGQGSPPTVADGTVYFGTNKAGDKANTVFAVDASTGTEQWRFTFTPEGDVRSSPAVANGTVFFGSDNGNVYALNASDGTEAWPDPFSTGGAVSSSPAVVNGVVYIGSNDGNVYLLDASTGEEIDRFGTGDAVTSSPAVANGNVYVGSLDGNLYGLEEGDGGNTAPTAAFEFTPDDPVVGEEVSFDASGSSDPDGSITSFEWDFDGDGNFEKTGEQVTHTFSESGDFSVTFKVTDDDGAEDTISKTVSVRSKLELDNVRVVQTVENSHVPAIVNSVPNPDLVKNRNTVTLFELNGTVSDGFLSSKVPFDIKWNFEDGSTINRSFKMKEEIGHELINNGKDIVELADDNGGLNELFEDGIPVFKATQNIKSLSLEIPDTATIQGDSETRSKSEGHFTIKDRPTINFGFIAVEDPENGQNYGTTRSGGAESYEFTCKKITDFVQNVYPSATVHVYIHEQSDPIVGTSDAGDFVRDLKDARDELEKIQNNQTISTEASLSGKIIAAEDGELIEDPKDIEISSFDETVAIVPGGDPDDYFEYHTGTSILGKHIEYETMFKTFETQPQTSSVVLEAIAESYVDSFDNFAREVGAQEIAHHFLNDPYSGNFSDLARQFPNFDSEHARDTLQSYKLDLEVMFDDLKEGFVAQNPDINLEISQGIKSFMSNESSPLWADELSHQRLIESQFDPQPPENELLTEPITILSGIKTDVGRTNLLQRLGRPLPKPSDIGDITDEVVIKIQDVAGSVIGQFFTADKLIVSHNDGSSTIEDIVIFVVPFPDETYKIRIDSDEFAEDIIPITRTLFDSLTNVPDRGFKRIPDQRRGVLNKKLEEIENMIDKKELHAARQKLMNDFQKMIELWLKDEYETAANQSTKQEILELVDDMIARLETLAQENS